MPRTGERGGSVTRARISEVATRLFLERGFDAVTVAEVARESGVSAVTVFNHYPRKEDLFFDRTDDARELLQAAVRDRATGTETVASLRAMTLRLVDERAPLSGVDPRSLAFYRTVAGSSALIGRAREIAAELQALLTSELERDPGFQGDAGLLASFVIAGYGTVLTGTAGRMLAGEPADALVADHRARFDRMFEALERGLGPSMAFA